MVSTIIAAGCEQRSNADAADGMRVSLGKRVYETQCASCHDVRPVRFPSAKAASTFVNRIENMDCPTEEALIRDMLTRLPQIDGLEFILTQRALKAVHTLPSSEPVEKALSDVGIRAVQVGPSAGTQTTVLAIAKWTAPRRTPDSGQAGDAAGHRFDDYRC